METYDDEWNFDVIDLKLKSQDYHLFGEERFIWRHEGGKENIFI